MRTACEKNILSFTTNDVSACTACFFYDARCRPVSGFMRMSNLACSAHDPRPVVIDIYKDDAQVDEARMENSGSLSPRKHPTINFATACNLIRTSAGALRERPTMAGLIFFVQVTSRI